MAGLLAVAACSQSTGEPPWPSPSGPVLATDHFSDPVGDGTPDLVEITTVATGDTVIFDVEFATDFDPLESVFTVLIADTAAAPAGACNAYLVPYWVELTAIPPFPSGEAWEAGLFSKTDAGIPALIGPLDTAILGPRVSFAVPLSLIGDPWPFRFRAFARGGETLDTLDRSPDSFDACHSVSLTIRHAIDPPGDGPADIAGVTTTTTERELMVEVELSEASAASPWQLLVSLFTSEERSSGCRYRASAAFEITDDGLALLAPWPAGDEPFFEVDGATVKLTIPLSGLEDPDTLYLAVRAVRPETIWNEDRFPESGCHAVPLVPGHG